MRRQIIRALTITYVSIIQLNKITNNNKYEIILSNERSPLILIYIYIYIILLYIINSKTPRFHIWKGNIKAPSRIVEQGAYSWDFVRHLARSFSKVWINIFRIQIQIIRGQDHICGCPKYRQIYIYNTTSHDTHLTPHNTSP